MASADSRRRGRSVCVNTVTFQLPRLSSPRPEWAALSPCTPEGEGKGREGGVLVNGYGPANTVFLHGYLRRIAPLKLAIPAAEGS